MPGKFATTPRRTAPWTGDARPADTVRLAQGRGRRLILLLMLATGNIVRADDASEARQYCARLRGLRLYSLAERYCYDRLADPRLSVADRIDFTAELTQTLAEHAAAVPFAEQSAYWQQARAAVDEALAAHGDHPRSIVLRVQAALVQASAGTLSRWQSELAAGRKAARDDALERLASATNELASLEKEFVALSRKPASEEPGRLRPWEIRDQLIQLRHRLALALMELAQVVPDEADRARHLIDAERLLHPLVEGAPQDPVTLSSQLALAAAARLRKDFTKAARILDALDAAAPPKPPAERIVAERVRVELERGDPAEAGRRLREYAQSGTLNPELRFLELAALMKMIDVARERKAAALQSELEQEFERRFAAWQTEQPAGSARRPESPRDYWFVRAAEARELFRDAARLGPELAARLHELREAAASLPPAEAARRYDGAARAAAERGDRALAFDLEYTAAALFVRAEQFDEACRVVDAIDPSHPRYADARLLRTFALGRLYEANPTRGRREQFEAALDDQRSGFPNHPSAGEAAFMRGAHDERRRQFSQAIAAYVDVPAGHPREPAARESAARCFDKQLEYLVENDAAAVDDVRRDAIARIEGWLAPIPAGRPWTLEETRLALRLARWYADRRPPNLRRIYELLEQIEDSLPETPNLPAPWVEIERAMLRQLVAVLAADNRFAEAEARLVELGESDPAELLAVLAGLNRAGAGPPVQSLAQLQLRVAEALDRQRARLDDKTRDELDFCRARARLALNNVEAAWKIYSQLLESPRRTPFWRRRAAAELLESGQRAAHEHARKLWSEEAAAHKAGSIAWFEARLELARCHARLGEAAAAAKILRQTRAVYPRLGNETLAAGYAALERELQAR